MKYFPNLTELNIGGNPIKKLDLSVAGDLEFLALNNCDLAKLDLSKLKKLNDVSLNNNRLPSVQSLGLTYTPRAFSFGDQRVSVDPDSKEAVCRIGKK